MSDVIKNKTLDSETVFEIFKEFYEMNNGDDATTDMLVSMFSQIFDISPDKLVEILFQNERKDY